MKQLRFKCSILKTFFPVLFHYLPKAEWYIAHQDRYNEQQRFKLTQDIVNLERRAAWTINDVHGLENMPAEGGFLMYANHQGKYDALAIISTVPRPCSVLWSKQSARRILASQVSRLVNSQIIDFKKPASFMGAVKNVAKEVQQGKPYIIFPEGKYSDNKNTLQEFQTGCFMSATMSKAPVVPVVLYDSYKSMDANQLFTKAVVQVHYLKPILYEEYKSMNRKELCELVKNRIQEKITDLGKINNC